MREYVEKMLHTKSRASPSMPRVPLYLRGLYSLERWIVFGVPFAVASPLETRR